MRFPASGFLPLAISILDLGLWVKAPGIGSIDVYSLFLVLNCHNSNVVVQISKNPDPFDFRY